MKCVQNVTKENTILQQLLLIHLESLILAIPMKLYWQTVSPDLNVKRAMMFIFRLAQMSMDRRSRSGRKRVVLRPKTL